MNCLQLSSRPVFCVKLGFPVFQKYHVPSLLIKASNSREATSGGEKFIQLSKAIASPQHCRGSQKEQPSFASTAIEKKLVRKSGKKEHHLWQRRDQAGSGHKAQNLVRIICGLPNEKAAVYSALDEWMAWETEFPLIAAAKALVILRKRSRWKRIIQVAKWMLTKGQGATMATYDHLLLAFDMDRRPDEAKMIWEMILQAHGRSISKRLFSRMISLYDHHNLPENVIEVFADMEELGVKPDEDTIRRIARAFEVLGQEDKQTQFLKKYQKRWKYIHFKGERVRGMTGPPRDTVHSLQKEVVEGDLLRDCVELGTDDLKSLIQVFKGIASQDSSAAPTNEL